MYAKTLSLSAVAVIVSPIPRHLLATLTETSFGRGDIENNNCRALIENRLRQKLPHSRCTFHMEMNNSAYNQCFIGSVVRLTTCDNDDLLIPLESSCQRERPPLIVPTPSNTVQDICTTPLLALSLVFPSRLSPNVPTPINPIAHNLPHPNHFLPSSPRSTLVRNHLGRDSFSFGSVSRLRPREVASMKEGEKRVRERVLRR